MADKKLKDLTPEIEAKIPEYIARCTRDLYNGTEYANWKREDTVEYVEYLYDMAKQEKPVVVIANTIREYKYLFNMLFGTQYPEVIEGIVKLHEMKNSGSDAGIAELENEFTTNLTKLLADGDAIAKKIKSNYVSPSYHYITIMSEYSRVYLMWYKFLKDEMKIDFSMADTLDYLYDKINKTNIAKVYACKKVCLVLRMPETTRRNDVGFHDASDKGAIAYPDQKFFYLNGRRVAEWIFEKYFDKTLTFEDFRKCTNEEDKGAIVTLIKENEGNEGLLKFLGAELVDEVSIPHADGFIDVQKLYKTKDKFEFARDSKGKSNVQLAWQEMRCASTGQYYLIETCPSLKTAEDSAKFLRPKAVPTELPYIWQSCN